MKSDNKDPFLSNQIMTMRIDNVEILTIFDVSYARRKDAYHNQI